MLRSASLACLIALLVPMAANTRTLTTLASLPSHVDGAGPEAALVELDGKYYGTTEGGGAGQEGTIFLLDPSSGQETIVYNFIGDGGGFPAAPMTGFAGKLYGTTVGGGAAKGGTVFSFDPATGTETQLYSFPDQFAQPLGGLAELGGLLYGVALLGGANGVGYIYSIDPATGAQATVHSFANDNDGRLPVGGVVAYNGALYGITAAGGATNVGTLFRLDPATGDVKTLYSFVYPNNIEFASSGLTVLNGVLYGTTTTSGSQNAGTVYAFDPTSGKFSVTYTFKAGTDGLVPKGGLLAVGGLLYGTTDSGGATGLGTVFSVDPKTGQETILHSFAGPDGYEPDAALIQMGNVLLGTTSSSAEGFGTIFSLDLSSLKETTLHAFVGSFNSVSSALIGFRGALYGTTNRGGSSNIGSIYKVNRRTGAAETIYSFSGPDGSNPSTALLNVGGAFYGTTSLGGANNGGTLFRFDPLSGKLETLFNLDDNTGTDPSGLTNVLGILYGTMAVGPGSSLGSLFSVDPSTGTLTTLHQFTFGEGYEPASGVVAVNGTLIGTAPYGGGNNGFGTVFSYALSSGVFSVIHTFEGGADGAYPSNGLIYANGALFGSTHGLKKTDAATIFRIDPTTGTETVLHTLPKSERLSTMIQVGDALFGTSSGPYKYGSIFGFEPATQEFRTLYEFKGGTDGGSPDAALIDIDGQLYGTTESITTGNQGTVFRYGR